MGFDATRCDTMRCDNVNNVDKRQEAGKCPVEKFITWAR